MIKRGMYGKDGQISLMVEAGGYVVNGDWRLVERDGDLVVDRTGCVTGVAWLCDWPKLPVFDYNQLMNEAQRLLGVQS